MAGYLASDKTHLLLTIVIYEQNIDNCMISIDSNQRQAEIRGMQALEEWK